MTDIQLTAEHISAADAYKAIHGPGGGGACPIARALRDMGYRRPGVGPTCAHYATPEGTAWLACSPDVERMVWRLIRDQPIEPCHLVATDTHLFTHFEAARLRAQSAQPRAQPKRDTSRKEP